MASLDSPAGSTSSALVCPACETSNTPDSKFCRHCGHLLRAPETRPRGAAPVSAQADDEDALTSPQEIDARRARQLLDRALHLSERGQLSAAVLACRQAATLAPGDASAPAMLGALLERSGDIRGAIAAYERVLALSPDNSLERDSLRRLQERLERAPAFHFDPDELFAEDATDLLPSVVLPSERAEAISPATSEAEALAPGTAAPHSVSTTQPVATETQSASLSSSESAEPEAVPAIEARLPPTSDLLSVEEPLPSGISAYAPTLAPSAAQEDAALAHDPFVPVEVPSPGPGAGNPAVSSLAQVLGPETFAEVAPAATGELEGRVETPREERRVARADRRQVNLPVAQERRKKQRRARPAAKAAPPKAAAIKASAPLFPIPAPRSSTDFSFDGPKVPSVPRSLDFQFSTVPAPKLPLWAQLLRGPSFFARTLPLLGVAVLGLGFLSWARSQAVSRAAGSPAPQVISAPNQDTTTTEVVTPVITPAPGAVAIATPVATGNSVLITNATPTPAPVATTAPAANAPTPGARAVNVSTPSAPRPRPATPVRSAPTFPSLAPAPVPPPPAPSARNTLILPPPNVAVAPPAPPPIQVGTPLVPGGTSSGRNTIRITSGTIGTAAPPRSGSAARGDERAASAAVSVGQSQQAITSLSNAIGNGGDSGYLYQQRGMTYLQQGQNARAASDFQNAISAYQDQINRGENVAAARAGLSAARSGLAMAQGGG